MHSSSALKLLAAAIMLGLPQCATAADRAATPAPEAYFPGDRDSVSGRLKAQCVAAGLDADRADDREVVCSRRLRGVQGAWAKYVVGRGSFDTKATQRVNFALLGSDEVILVRARRDIGPNPKAQSWDARSFDEVMAMLQEAGGKPTRDEAAATAIAAPRTAGSLMVQPAPR